jgi:hypothetical protein
MNPEICASSIATECEPSYCRQRCALEVIDELLSAGDVVSGEEADRLLDLRWQLRQGTDAEAALRVFCDLRIRMEHRHYLAFFRLRRWLEQHLVASVQLCPAAAPQMTPVKLDRYCIEAIRRLCLCAALGRGSVLLAPRVRFAFQHVTVQAAELAETAGESVQEVEAASCRSA